MSKHTPYENLDQEFNELPLPDQEQSWEKMKQMLDEDDRRRRVLPPVFFTCAGWTVALLLLVAATWLVLRPQNWWKDEKTAKKDQELRKTHTPPENKPVTEMPFAKDPLKKDTKETPPYGQDVPAIPEKKRADSKNNSLVSTTAVRPSGKAARSHQPGIQKAQLSAIDINKPAGRRSLPDSTSRPPEKKLQAPNKARQPADTSRFKVALDKKISSADSAMSTVKAGPTGIEEKDSIKTDEAIASTETKKDKKRISKKFAFSAGLGLQQQIPVMGQKAVPYSYYGRKGSLSDYIPSVFLKMERPGKWFLMGEFRYGAPQSVKEFSYSRQSKADTGFTHITTTTMRLKKTYYHQLPLSFNYYVLPNWSVGLGAMYSRFYGAVTEREVLNRNVQTNTETVTKQIVHIKHFNDSFLYKTQAHLLVQTDYQWKRFSFSLRYTMDMQPYIRFTRPTGEVEEEKNQTLQLIARFRLWRSR